MNTATPWLRPSALPKLALCAQYSSDPVSGPAAERGTKIDEAFRAVLAHENVSLEGWPEEDKDALRWAVDTAKRYAGGAELESREGALRVKALGMEGTADLLCPSARWAADLKTGQMRNYREQQALYALGFMDDFFEEEWTVYLIYCDQEQVERLHFTREEAEALVRGVLAKVRGDEPPEANEYCGWCASRFTCEARREALGIVPFDAGSTVLIADAPSEQLANFARRAKVVEEFNEEVRAELLRRCLAGQKIEGVSVTTKVGSRVINTADLPELSLENLRRLIGSKISEKKAREVCGDSFPADKVIQGGGSAYVTIRKAKEAK